MNPDVVVLAVASAPRPAGLAALYVLLRGSPPRRVVVAYLVAGLTFSVAVGVLVVAIFQRAGIDYRGTDVYSVIELSQSPFFLLCDLLRQARTTSVGDHPGASQCVGDYGVGRGCSHSPPRALLPDRPTGHRRRGARPRRRGHGGAALQRHLVRCDHRLGRALSAPSRSCPQGARPRRRLGRRHARTITVLVFSVAGSYLVIRGVTGLVG